MVSPFVFKKKNLSLPKAWNFFSKVLWQHVFFLNSSGHLLIGSQRVMLLTFLVKNCNKLMVTGCTGGSSGAIKRHITYAATNRLLLWSILIAQQIRSWYI